MTAVGAPARPMTGLRRMLITACAMIATLMQALDTTNATMALPYMRSSLSAGPDQITWVLTSYVIMAAIMTACVGWFAKRFGHRRCFLIAMAGFTIASMLSGQASSLTEIVIFRLLQGAFGAALIPLSQSTLLDIYPVEQRGFGIVDLGHRRDGWAGGRPKHRWLHHRDVSLAVDLLHQCADWNCCLYRALAVAGQGQGAF